MTCPSSCKHSSSLTILLLLLLFTTISIASTTVERHRGEAAKHKKILQNNNNNNKNDSSFSAIFIFGDSTADPGNNNFVKTTFRCNFPPYGRDFPDHLPTGRFTNGRLGSDFIASYVGVKEFVPPYLDPTLSIEELKTGVSFASAGSGFDPLTPKVGNVVPLTKQLEYFKEWKRRVGEGIGNKETERVVKDGLYLISAGTNDFVINYFTLPIRSKTYTLSDYMQFLLSLIQQTIQGIFDEGGRRIAMVGLSPMGCLPLVITMYSGNPIRERGCLDYYSSVARDFNSMLISKLNDIQSRLQNQGARIVYLDGYTPLLDFSHGTKYGFEEYKSGCCGTGLFETSYFCNPKSYVCPDASKYLFWDSIHPTERTYYLLAQAFKPAIQSLIPG